MFLVYFCVFLCFLIFTLFFFFVYLVYNLQSFDNKNIDLAKVKLINQTFFESFCLLVNVIAIIIVVVINIFIQFLLIF